MIRRLQAKFSRRRDADSTRDTQQKAGRYAILKEAIRDAVLIVGYPEGRILDANEVALTVYGYSREELLSLSVADLRSSASSADLRKQMERAMRHGVLFESVHLRKDGSPFPVEVGSRGTHFRGEAILVSTVRDITERRILEEEIKNSLCLLRKAQEIARLGSYVFHVAAGFWTTSELLDQIFGIGPDYVRSVAGWVALVHPEERLSMKDYFVSRVLGEKEPFDREYRIVRASDGEIRWVHGLGRVETDAEGRAVRMVGTIQDVTDRRRAEAAAHRSAELFRAIFESAGDNIFLLGLQPDGPPVILDVNRKGVELHGFKDKAELIGKSVAFLDPEVTPASASERAARLRETGALVLRVTHRRKDGTPLPLEVHTTLTEVEGEPYVIAVERDISERVALESRLQQAQRMEAIGTLAGGIAHDFNNILTPIVAHAELALLQLREDDALKEDLLGILAAAGRAGALVKQILSVSRKEDSGAPVPVNVGLLVKETAKFLRATVPSTIDLTIDVDPACRPVLSEPSRLHQVLLNLCTNASYAMAETGGTLSVSLRPVSKGGWAAHGRSHWVLLTVADTGPGIPPELQARIFDPYFTTKPVGKGSGLGLAVVQGIVSGLGGEVRLRSDPGRGATFEVLLPAVDAPGAEVPVPRVEVPLGKGQHLLVVDDEEEIRRVLSDIFRNLGYRVTPCADGAEALEAYRLSPEAFGAVLTDYTMPRMNGLELAEELHAADPALPIVLGTGFAEPVDAGVVGEFGIKSLVMKPYNRERIAVAIADALS